MRTISREELIVDIIATCVTFGAIVYTIAFFIPTTVISEGMKIWVILGACLVGSALGFSLFRLAYMLKRD